MAPTCQSYSTSLDIEGFLQSHTPPSRQSKWPMYAASVFGITCALVLALQSMQPSTTVLPVQTRSAQTVVPVQQLPVDTRVAPNVLQKVGSGLAALSLTAMANLGTPFITPASELDVLSTPTPTSEYIYDDGGLLSKATLGELSAQLPQIEAKTGYRINVITLRKLITSEDAFQFADNLIETWYPTAELGDKKAVFVIVKNSKEGGLVGGPSFSQTVPGSVIESIINDNVGTLLEQEKFNLAVQSTVSRLEAVLSGQADPGAPKAAAKADPKQSATYKTKDQTDSKRDLYVGVFGGLVAISFIAPMVQFFGYTKDDK